MNPHPLRLLLVGYTMAACVAVGFQVFTGALLGALLVFWLGGAAVVLILAALPGLSKPFRTPEDALEAEFRRWEDDRLTELEAAAAARDRAVAG